MHPAVATGSQKQAEFVGQCGPFQRVAQMEQKGEEKETEVEGKTAKPLPREPATLKAERLGNVHR